MDIQVKPMNFCCGFYLKLMRDAFLEPTSEELKVMVTKNGGVYTHYYSKTKVTHIIASNLPTSKINHLKDEKVCSPEWIVER